MNQSRLEDSDPKVIATDDARQGVTGHGVRYVLGISLTLAIIALGLVWLGFFG